jgi:hypothetical protein
VALSALRLHFAALLASVRQAPVCALARSPQWLRPVLDAVAARIQAEEAAARAPRNEGTSAMPPVGKVLQAVNSHILLCLQSSG